MAEEEMYNLIDPLNNNKNIITDTIVEDKYNKLSRILYKIINSAYMDYSRGNDAVVMRCNIEDFDELKKLQTK